MSQTENRSTSAPKRARIDGSRREDDWTCPGCGNVNFSFRATCNMRNCSQPRPADHNIKHGANLLQPVHGGGPYPGSGTPPSMYLNVPQYGSSVFNGRAIPPPYELPFSVGSPYQYTYGSRYSSGTPYRPLHLSGSPYAGSPMMGNVGLYGVQPFVDRYGLGLSMSHPGMGPKAAAFFSDDPQCGRISDGSSENDWTCPNCGNINFSFRTICNMRKCNTPKPEPKGAKPEKHNRPPTPEGSWKCEKCSNINYPFRTKCNRPHCGAEKPAASPSPVPSGQ